MFHRSNFQTKPEINSLKYSILVSTRLTNQNSPSQVDKTTKDSGNRHGMVPYGDTEIFDISDGTNSITISIVLSCSKIFFKNINHFSIRIYHYFV